MYLGKSLKWIISGVLPTSHSLCSMGLMGNECHQGWPDFSFGKSKPFRNRTEETSFCVLQPLICCSTYLSKWLHLLEASGVNITLG